MLDKQIGYGFNVSNDPPPAGTTMEDGQAPSPANARASNKTPKALETAEKLSSTFAESMKSSMIVLADALRTQNKSPKTQPGPKKTFCADVGEHLDLIQSP